jgi:hypothetical protein
MTQTVGPGTPVIVVDSKTFPDGEVKIAYPTTTLSVINGTAPYKWTLAPGSALPASLKLKANQDTSTVMISGKPAKAGSYNFTVRVTDNLGSTVAKGLAIMTK